MAQLTERAGFAVRMLLLGAPLIAVTGTAVAQQLGDPGRGHDYAARNCAECHAVDGTRPSPNRDAPSFAAVANTPGMTEMALGVFLFTPHRQMPDLIIPTAAARDVIAYILRGVAPNQ
jgi:mono/diheme cytochrome c family protein